MIRVMFLCLFLSGCGFTFNKPKEPAPEWHKFLTKEALIELKSIPDCVYFIAKGGEITSHCN